MARTQRNTVDYFPHDASSSEGDTLTILQSKFGNDGYAGWFKILEKLASTDGHFLDLSSPIKWQLFIARMGVKEITVTEILLLLSEMQAIDKELWQLKIIWCQHLVDNVADVYKKRGRETPLKPIIDNDKVIPATRKAITNPEITQSKVKDIKEKKMKKQKQNPVVSLIEKKETDRLIGSSFNTFWNNYPKKEAKKRAQSAFNALKPDVQLFALMIEKLAQFCATDNWKKENGKYIPLPATWITGRRWEDEIIPTGNIQTSNPKLNMGIAQPLHTSGMMEVEK